LAVPVLVALSVAVGLMSYCWPSAKVTVETFADQVENAVPVLDAVKVVAVPEVPLKFVPFQNPFASPCFWIVTVTPLTPDVPSDEVPVIEGSVFLKLAVAGVATASSGFVLSELKIELAVPVLVALSVAVGLMSYC